MLEKTRLTTSERLIWLGQRLFPNSPLNNIPLVFRLPAGIDRLHFERAFRRVASDFDALRTTFTQDGDAPVRRVGSTPSGRLEFVDLSSVRNPSEQFRKWVDARATMVFDLSETLYDSVLIKTGPDEHCWFLNQHHIITDGWSTAVVVEHMFKCYEASLENQLAEVATPPPYSDYVEYEHSLRESSEFQHAREFWTGKMKDAGDPPALYGVPSGGQGPHALRLTADLGPERSAALRGWVRNSSTPLLTEQFGLFSVFALLAIAFVHRISGSSDTCIGTPAQNRPTSAFKVSAGLFIELFPLRIRVEADDTFNLLFSRVQRDALEFLKYAVPGTSDSGFHRHYNVILNYVTSSFPAFSDQRLAFEWPFPDAVDSNHALRLQVHDYNETGSFSVFFDLNTSVFDQDLQSVVVQHFLEIVDAFLADPSMRLSELVLRPGSPTYDRSAIPAFLQEDSVLTSFEETARRSPGAIAIECDEHSITYGDLNTMANRIGALLLDAGVQAGEPVIVLLPRSIEYVASVLGAMKAGAPFCPIPSNVPGSRLATISDDLNDPIIVTNSGLISKTEGLKSKAVLVENAPFDPVIRRPEPARLAYIMFTSGSTGRPKGVSVSHGAFANYVSWAAKAFDPGYPPAWAFFSSVAFDLTLTSIFAPLISGGRVIVYPEREADSDFSILEALADHRANVIKLTPSHLSLIRDVDVSSSRLKYVVVGGERLPHALALRAIGDLPSEPVIFNEYGPTEATVGCIAHRFDPETDHSESVPIGLPIDGASAYVLNDLMQDVPTGSVGRLYLAGRCLADGYWQNETETGNRFIKRQTTGERLYDTGDVVRILPSGALEYLGRVDDQVKIRGFRIEPAEIEGVIASHPAVAECAVVAIKRSPKVRIENPAFCVRCGLSSALPGTRIDPDGVCDTCHSFEEFASNVDDYWGDMDDLELILRRAEGSPNRTHDCLVLLSGGKDSTYALSRIVEMNLKVLAFTLDNGFISEQAKDNIRRVTTELGVDHVFAETRSMNAIFADSLSRHSNVCNGCFKTIYTLSLKEALDRSIPTIVTGLSRGQLFETRLTGDLFAGESVDAGMIDLTVLEARKAYHRIDDPVARLLDASWLNDETLNRVSFVDFYRYCDVELSDMFAHLDDRLPWIRPADTGRSTNCLINDLGIYVHQQVEGYHNYALPYSWDVRLGHKNRDQALEELDDWIDESRVRQLMKTVGFSLDTEDVSLVAYVVPEQPGLPDLRDSLSDSLPSYMIPTSFVEVSRLPLTDNGKVDRARLIRAEGVRGSVESDHVAPRNEVEEVLCDAWERVLVCKVGVNDNFFEIGGDSIRAIQVVTLVSKQGFALEPTEVFRHQTVAELAKVCRRKMGPTGPIAGETGFKLEGHRLSQLGDALAKLRDNE